MRIKSILVGFALSAAMTFGICAGLNSSKTLKTNAEKDKVYYFQDTQDWGSMYVHLFDGTSDANTTWPGIQLKVKYGQDAGHDMYYFKAPGDHTKFILNNGSGTQTEDLSFSDFTGSNDALWINSTKDDSGHHYKGGIWDYNYSYSAVLKGSRDDWTNGFGTLETTNDSRTLTVHLDYGEEFKFVIQSTYYGYSYLDSPANNLKGENDSNISVEVSGTYVFTIPNNVSSGSISYTMTSDVANGPYLRGEWGSQAGGDWGWSEAGQKPMSGSGPYTVNDVPLSAEGEIKMVIYNNGVITWTQPSGDSAGTTDFPAARTGEGGNVAVEKDGIYDVTVTLVSGTTYTYSLVGRADADLSAATTFATNFVTDMYAGCPYNYSTGKYNTGKTSETLADLWENKLEAYAVLSEKAKNYLSTNEGSSVLAISTMWTTYDYVYGHYASVRAVNENNADFLGRNPTPVANYSTHQLGINNAQNTILLIVVISSISLISLGGFFLLKKKKEN